MNEVREILRELFVDRLKNKFFGAFVFALIVWNWRIPCEILFGQASTSVTERLSFTANYSYWDVALRIAGPAIAAITYLVTIPWINILIDRIQRLPLAVRQSEQDESNNKRRDAQDDAEHQREKKQLQRKLELAKLREELEIRRLNLESVTKIREDWESLVSDNVAAKAQEFHTSLAIQMEEDSTSLKNKAKADLDAVFEQQFKSRFESLDVEISKELERQQSHFISNMLDTWANDAERKGEAMMSAVANRWKTKIDSQLNDRLESFEKTIQEMITEAETSFAGANLSIQQPNEATLSKAWTHDIHSGQNNKNDDDDRTPWDELKFLWKRFPSNPQSAFESRNARNLTASWKWLKPFGVSAMENLVARNSELLRDHFPEEFTNWNVLEIFDLCLLIESYRTKSPTDTYELQRALLTRYESVIDWSPSLINTLKSLVEQAEKKS